MKPRERVIATITLDKPDRAPILHSPLPCALLKYGEEINKIFTRYPQDFGPSKFDIPKKEDLPPDYRKGIHKDEWGTFWISSADGIHGQVYDYPIKNWEDLDEYEFPPLPDRSSNYYIQELTNMKTKVLSLKNAGYCAMLGWKPGNFFERMQWLRGFKNLFIDFLTKPKALYKFADDLLDYCLRSISLAVEAHPDILTFSDDWGTQDRLMVNPVFWRDFFKPRYKKMFKIVHDSGAYVYFHSDGYIMDILPDLIEIGVDVLNPQFSCVNLEKLAIATRNKICISSDIDRQYVLPRGTTHEVDAYVKKVVELFSNGGEGGLILRGEISIDVPLENIEAMYRAFEKYGKYRERRQIEIGLSNLENRK